MIEIGTGTGVGTCWLLDGMDEAAKLTTVDIDPKVRAIARAHRGGDPRLTILSEDGAALIRRDFQRLYIDWSSGVVVMVRLGVERP